MRKVFFIIIAMLIVIVAIYGWKTMIPNLEDIAAIRAEVIVSKTLNETVGSVLEKNERSDDLFEMSRDEQGNMKLVRIDSAEVNLIMTDTAVRLQKAFSEMKNEKYEVPVGSIAGSRIFSQSGPKVTINIIPLSVSSMDYRTEFETKGINQTRYRIYIIIKCKIRVIAPFMSNQIETVNTLPVAEAVILGEVPNSYVQVPEEDILDVTDE